MCSGNNAIKVGPLKTTSQVWQVNIEKNQKKGTVNVQLVSELILPLPLCMFESMLQNFLT